MHFWGDIYIYILRPWDWGGVGVDPRFLNLGRCTATECPQADWAGCVLRVAGHDFMDFGDGEGGSDGCLDLFDPDNAGLPECLHSGEFGFSIQDSMERNEKPFTNRHHLALASLANPSGPAWCRRSLAAKKD
eukprot:6192475-Amphidinium_carterae.1